jgi:hypothetical protein
MSPTAAPGHRTAAPHRFRNILYQSFYQYILHFTDTGTQRRFSKKPASFQCLVTHVPHACVLCRAKPRCLSRVLTSLAPPKLARRCAREAGAVKGGLTSERTESQREARLRLHTCNGCDKPPYLRYVVTRMVVIGMASKGSGMAKAIKASSDSGGGGGATKALRGGGVRSPAIYADLDSHPMQLKRTLSRSSSSSRVSVGHHPHFPFSRSILLPHAPPPLVYTVRRCGGRT